LENDLTTPLMVVAISIRGHFTPADCWIRKSRSNTATYFLIEAIIPLTELGRASPEHGAQEF
jgi:hypothetical protein